MPRSSPAPAQWWCPQLVRVRGFPGCSDGSFSARGSQRETRQDVWGWPGRRGKGQVAWKDRPAETGVGVCGPGGWASRGGHVAEPQPPAGAGVLVWLGTNHFCLSFYSWPVKLRARDSLACGKGCVGWESPGHGFNSRLCCLSRRGTQARLGASWWSPAPRLGADMSRAFHWGCCGMEAMLSKGVCSVPKSHHHVILLCYYGFDLQSCLKKPKPF